MNDEELTKFVDTFYEENPFYPKWPFARLTPEQRAKMEADNKWYQSLKGQHYRQFVEDAPF